MLGLDPLEVGNEGKYIIGVVGGEGAGGAGVFEADRRGQERADNRRSHGAVQRRCDADAGWRQKNNR